MQSNLKPVFKTSNPIVIVEDDRDDCEMLIETFKEIGVLAEFRCFENGALALDYLRTTNETPFIIISDINMPKMDGLAFKRAIDEDVSLRKRKSPFVFLSTSKEQELLQIAFSMPIQGFFTKPSDFNSLKDIANVILSYWKKSSFV